ncbi:hypothetical protein F4604DRAFT_1682471 [Suillus subluteus]|nr:hypothetical protein F4604DRAFT_1682471 [Suillus subluteus]
MKWHRDQACAVKGQRKVVSFKLPTHTSNDLNGDHAAQETGHFSLCYNVGVRFVVTASCPTSTVAKAKQICIWDNSVHAEDKFLDAEQALLYVDEIWRTNLLQATDFSVWSRLGGRRRSFKRINHQERTFVGRRNELVRASNSIKVLLITPPYKYEPILKRSAEASSPSSLQRSRTGWQLKHLCYDREKNLRNSGIGLMPRESSRSRNLKFVIQIALYCEWRGCRCDSPAQLFVYDDVLRIGILDIKALYEKAFAGSYQCSYYATEFVDKAEALYGLYFDDPVV